ncbi:undecaprenyl-phosphate glucose phosphotransferase [Kaistia nematophila]|uniref:Undecaprenyl-phosphate glucose phosphotransferase n=1 Tax=Kaistia nematophila TaxID=2994654 RepID=A0A9X3IJJ7_9HYPH|nr:undecaprenyl-phosphate glucose phosphotransferase [Kaistia nematophila]MCX5568639.1 undecaprenyl-phosphate glucose phosphotransferase [Kaistia nematophila]
MTIDPNQSLEASPHRASLNQHAREVAAALSKEAISPRLLAGAVQAIEAIALILIGLAFWPSASSAAVPGLSELLLVVAAPLIAIFGIRSIGGYSIGALRDYLPVLSRILIGWALTIAIVAAGSFFFELQSDGRRAWLGIMFLVGATFFILERVTIAALVHRWTGQGRLERRAVIVGGGELAAELLEALGDQGRADVRICGLFDDRGGDRSPDEVAGVPKLGTVAELVEFARLARIDLLIVALPMSAENRVLQLLKRLWVLPVDIRISALGSKLRFTPRSYSYVGPVPLVDLFDRPIAGWDSLLKRAFDIVIATLALIVLSPVMLLTAIAIRLDSPGPVLFRQKRYGFNNEVIEVFKFRSMYHHMSDPAAKVAVTKGDARVTRIGRFIRRTSLDELPQLVNVLRGELSLVGPRPHAVNAHTENRLWDEVVDGYFARHKVKPGVTGWAQINGWRGEVDTPEKIRRRVEFDLQYIERWSVPFDLYILMMTPFSLINSENAY